MKDTDIDMKHEATAGKLGLWIDPCAHWCVIRVTGEMPLRLTDEDVKLMLRREGYKHQAGGMKSLSEMQSFRLWCLEHRRLKH